MSLNFIHRAQYVGDLTIERRQRVGEGIASGI